MNYSDAERISAIMEEIGYKKTENQSKADVILLVTCSVRQSAENRIFGLNRVVSDLRENNPKLKIVLTGCMAERNFRTEINQQKRSEKNNKYQNNLIKKLPWVDYTLKIENISNLYNIFGESKTGISKNEYLSIVPKYKSKFIAYVPISTGCNNFCSYCIVPFTRGPEKSRPKKEIIDEVKMLINKGYKEINLLGQNVNSYGNDFKKKDLFPKLLQEINEIDGDFWIRFVSCHPKDVSTKLIKVMADSNHIVNHVHFALQSGNDDILKKMNRPYTRQKYIDTVNKIKSKIPEIALTTDVIVGFPTETVEQFEDTKNLIKYIGFSMVYINIYSPRTGTLSSKMKDDVTHLEKVRRKEILNEILKESSLNYNSRFLDKTIIVLITRKKGNNLVGHNAEGVDVEINTNNTANMENLIGKFTKIKITEINSWGMKGVIDES